MITRPEDVKALFQSPADGFRTSLGAMKPLVGDQSLFVMDGERHRRHRRLIGPPLRGERLHVFAGLIGELAGEEVRSWKTGSPFAIIEPMRALTLRVIMRAIFGIYEGTGAQRVSDLITKLTSAPTAALAFFPRLQVDLGPRSPWGRFLRLNQELRTLFLAEVQRARREAAGRQDILARLTQEGSDEADKLGDEEIVDEMITLLAAGHESSTAALAWTFQYILADATLWGRLVDEVRSASTGDELTHAALEAMPLLEATVLETMRLMPVAPVVPRHCVNDTTINDLTVPAGTHLTACAYLTQRDAQVYPEPETFRPERFLGKRPSPFELYPFGGGHRHCIGAALSLYEMRAILAGVLKRADLERPAAVQPQRVVRRGILMIPSAGTPVVLRSRRN